MQTALRINPRRLTAIRLDGRVIAPWTAEELAEYTNTTLAELPALLAATTWTVDVRSSSHTAAMMAKWYRPGRVWLRGYALIDLPHGGQKHVRIYTQHRAFIDLRYGGKACYATRAIAAAEELCDKLSAAGGDVAAIVDLLD